MMNIACINLNSPLEAFTLTGQMIEESQVHTTSIRTLILINLNVLYHIIPYKLCGCEVKDVHSLQSFVSTNCEESDSVLFTLCLQFNNFMLLT